MSGPKSVSSGKTNLSGGADSASSDASSDSESDDGTGASSDSELEVDPPEPSPVPLTRPADPNKAIEYDLIKTVWARKRSTLTGPVIRTALSETWNIFTTIRDNWKKKSTSLQQAIEKKDSANKNAYERRVVEQRKLLENCIRLTLKHGHPSIVERLGENPKLLVVLYQFLADRIKESEFTGSLIASMLELIAQCNSVDASLLEKTKIDKILPRLEKRGDDQGKTLVRKILDNAAAATKKQRASSVDDAASVSKGGANGVEHQATKTTGSSKGTSADIKKGSDNEKKNLKGTANTKTTQSSSEADSTKVKVIQTSTKPSNFFAGLQSASKKPGTSNKGKDGQIR